MIPLESVPAIDEPRVVAAIAAAELRTSGEIRVVITRQPAHDPVGEAQRHFARLGMNETAARNGILIFVAPASRTFALVGDKAVHERGAVAAWREIADTMSEQIKRAEFTAGLLLGIDRAAALLATQFPCHPNDGNELPDTVEYVD